MQGRKVMLLLLLLGSLKTAQITFQEKLARFARLRLKVSKTSEGSEVEEKKKGKKKLCKMSARHKMHKFKILSALARTHTHAPSRGWMMAAGYVVERLGTRSEKLKLTRTSTSDIIYLYVFVALTSKLHITIRYLLTIMNVGG